MDEKARKEWEEQRAGGMIKYVLFKGLPWGLAMFLAMTFVAHPERSRGTMLYVSACLWLAGGVLFGIGTWYVQDRAYKKSLGR
jgi:hypothetical protein